MPFHCIDCQSDSTDVLNGVCALCGGLIDVSYAEYTIINSSQAPNVRYRNLLPVVSSQALHRIPTWQTPLRADRHFNCHNSPSTYFKDETPNATGSTKDRMASIAIPFLFERGVRTIALSSTGNSALAIARALNFFPEMNAHFFLGTDFLEPVASSLSQPRIEVHEVASDYAEARIHATQFARAHAIYDDQGFLNLGRREGLKTAYLEAYEQMPLFPDVVVQAVSSGMGIWAAYKAATEFAAIQGRVLKLPRFVCAQEATCAPMVTAARAGSIVIRPQDVVTHPVGLAKALLLGNPSGSYPWVSRIVRHSTGRFVAVSHDEIVASQKRIAIDLEIPLCKASAVAVAAADKLRMEGWITEEESVLVLLGGREPG